MNEFRDKTAVITGAASGIGRALAECCLREGMKVVLADVERAALLKTESELMTGAARLLSVPTDVSRADDVKELAGRTISEFGSVDLLFNNAGVAAGGSVWDCTLADWEWVLGVNLWGVIHPLRTFLPIMLAQNSPSHVVNTASIAGLLPFHPSAPYQVTKHAVVALSEQLHYSLALRRANVKVSVLCPQWVNTRIVDCERNRPLDLQNETSDGGANPDRDSMVQSMRNAAQAGLSPGSVADDVFKAIRQGQFYVLPQDDMNLLIRQRMENILARRNPA